MNKHCAYNLTTGEILEAPTAASLHRHLAFIQRIDRKSFGLYKCEWIFGHKGINAIVAKANRIGRQRLGR